MPNGSVTNIVGKNSCEQPPEFLQVESIYSSFSLLNLERRRKDFGSELKSVNAIKIYVMQSKVEITLLNRHPCDVG